MNARKWFFAATMCATTALAQNALPLDPCHEMPSAASAKNFFTFDQFDRELRAAISKQDAVALAFLVDFPLRVNDAGGTISIDDAAALKTHFQEVFTPAVRKAILSEKFASIRCNEEGLMYGLGTIWVNASERGYAIVVVNRDATPMAGNPGNKAKLDFICQTSAHRIVVDTSEAGVLRYRSWNRPRSLTDSPDLEIVKGDATFEGTGLCAYAVYTFKKGTAVYQVSEGPACFSDAEPPPAESTGLLQVTVGNGASTETWCY